MIPHFSGANEHRVRSYQWVTDNQDELVTKRVNAATQMFAKHQGEREAAGEHAAVPDAGEVTSQTLS